MTLKIINNHIVFQPPFADIENALLDTYDTVLRGASEIPRFEYALDPDEDEKPVCLKPTILKEIIDKAKQNVRNVVHEQMKGNNNIREIIYRPISSRGIGHNIGLKIVCIFLEVLS